MERDTKKPRFLEAFCLRGLLLGKLLLAALGDLYDQALVAFDDFQVVQEVPNGV